MNWQVGDRAIVVGCPSWHGCGETVTLIRLVREDEFEGVYAGHWVLDLEPDHDTCYCSCDEAFLRPIPDTYDGLEISSWDAVEKDIDWNPTRITV